MQHNLQVPSVSKPVYIYIYFLVHCRTVRMYQSVIICRLFFLFLMRIETHVPYIHGCTPGTKQSL